MIHEDELPIPSEKTLQRLNEMATSRLAQIARISNSPYNENEVNAVKQLLDGSTQAVIR